MKKVAIVTGGAGGIGAATCRALAAEGLAVAVLDVDAAGAARVAGEISMGAGAAHAVVCDVGNRASVEAAIADVSKLGQVSVLVNNAGIGGPFHRVDEVTDEEWDRIVATNLKSVFLFARALLPGMKARGHGRVVNIASVQGIVGAARSSTYAATKHGMLGYTKSIAAEWGAYGITCNAICPGYVDTTMGAGPSKKVDAYLERVLERTPVGRVARPEEIAALVVYLTGPSAGYVNGASFVVDGGLTAHSAIT
ncbi:MAG: SDR family oxidoreductase [Deltaproteobacteria bacterium]|nr:SDR family oxidoreductase [Deltaproteobacteria bacterium]